MATTQSLKKRATKIESGKQWSKGIGINVADRSTAGVIFEPDILIANQFLATYVRNFHLEPEKTLMFAVLQDALTCFQYYVGATDKRRQQLFIEAHDWFMSEDNGYLFSFENICALLGFTPSYLRRGLLRWQEDLLSKRLEERRAS